MGATAEVELSAAPVLRLGCAFVDMWRCDVTLPTHTPTQDAALDQYDETKRFGRCDRGFEETGFPVRCSEALQRREEANVGSTSARKSRKIRAGGPV